MWIFNLRIILCCFLQQLIFNHLLGVYALLVESFSTLFLRFFTQFLPSCFWFCILHTLTKQVWIQVFIALCTIPLPWILNLAKLILTLIWFIALIHWHSADLGFIIFLVVNNRRRIVYSNIKCLRTFLFKVTFSVYFLYYFLVFILNLLYFLF